MREDMSKVVIERPRHNHSDPSRKTGLRIRSYDPDEEYDDLPTRMPTSRGRGTKYFSDFLSPLRRFLRSNVGRPWDKVYSEMRQHLDFRKTTGRHVFEHVEAEVSLHCFISDDGKVYERGRYGGRSFLVTGLYVHPRTGLLCWQEPRNRRKERQSREASKEVTRIHLSGKRHYVKLNGIWYIAEVEGEPLYYRSATGGGDGEFITEDYFRWKVLRKKQCGSRELRAAGLSNTPAE
ncbi:MAG TPA: hypothetical protein VFD58_03180 [Blastocatellia bacterium]|nr:hypothetical protein [Blastocatellia bacterium]